MVRLLMLWVVVKFLTFINIVERIYFYFFVVILGRYALLALNGKINAELYFYKS